MEVPQIKRIDIDPKEDGITHVNISSKGATELGRILNDTSDLLVDFCPYYKNPDKKTYYFSAYGWFAFTLTGSKNLDLAGATMTYIRDYMRENKLSWSRVNINSYIRGLRKRIERSDVLDMMSNNELPIVSYRVHNGRVVFVKNNRLLSKEYNYLSALMSGRATTK